MTTNWSTFLLANSRLPETIDEAIDRLIMVLDNEQKATLATRQEEDLIDLHFGLGKVIRNALGLHKLKNKLLSSFGVVHPDEASVTIHRSSGWW